MKSKLRSIFRVLYLNWEKNIQNHLKTVHQEYQDPFSQVPTQVLRSGKIIDEIKYLCNVDYLSCSCRKA